MRRLGDYLWQGPTEGIEKMYYEKISCLLCPFCEYPLKE